MTRVLCSFTDGDKNYGGSVGRVEIYQPEREKKRNKSPKHAKPIHDKYYYCSFISEILLTVIAPNPNEN